MKALILALVVVLLFVTPTKGEFREIVREEFSRCVAQPPIECDTDSDCMRKNGGGGR